MPACCKHVSSFAMGVTVTHRQGAAVSPRVQAPRGPCCAVTSVSWCIYLVALSAQNPLPGLCLTEAIHAGSHIRDSPTPDAGRAGAHSAPVPPPPAQPAAPRSALSGALHCRPGRSCGRCVSTAPGKHGERARGLGRGRKTGVRRSQRLQGTWGHRCPRGEGRQDRREPLRARKGP